MATSVSVSTSLLPRKFHSRLYQHHPHVRRISSLPTTANFVHKPFTFFSGKKGKVGSWSPEHLLTVSSSSSEGDINELMEESKFVPLNADEPVYGPPALLLLGFDKNETLKVLQLLKDIDGEFLKVIHCTEDMLSLSVWHAMHIEQPNLENVEVAESLPRMCILSGLSGEEMLMFIDAFPEAGFEPAVFAALVPNSANKLLEEVVEEIMGDHEMMTARKQSG